MNCDLYKHILKKFFGNIILKDLVKKVFHPNRLLNISNQYNIDVIDLVDMY